jgi:homoserine dehydrogenase
MEEVRVGIVGLGNVGSGTLAILAENADQIALKLGFRLKVAAVCSRSVHGKQLPAGIGEVFKTTDWREVVTHPDVQIVAELVGGTGVAAEIIEAAIEHRKSVVTANKELMAACGAEIWDRAIKRRHQPGDGSQRVRRHSDSRGAARGHLGRSRAWRSTAS